MHTLGQRRLGSQGARCWIISSSNLGAIHIQCGRCAYWQCAELDAGGSVICGFCATDVLYGAHVILVTHGVQRRHWSTEIGAVSRYSRHLCNGLRCCAGDAELTTVIGLRLRNRPIWKSHLDRAERICGTANRHCSVSVKVSAKNSRVINDTGIALVQITTGFRTDIPSSIGRRHLVITRWVLIRNDH